MGTSEGCSGAVRCAAVPRRRVDLRAEVGELVAIIGPSASDRLTLLDIVGTSTGRRAAAAGEPAAWWIAMVCFAAGLALTVMRGDAFHAGYRRGGTTSSSHWATRVR